MITVDEMMYRDDIITTSQVISVTFLNIPHCDCPFQPDVKKKNA